MFALEVSKRVQREIWRLSDQDRKRLVKEIDKLVADPFTRRKRIKKLKGMKDGWRLRVGGIRALLSALGFPIIVQLSWNLRILSFASGLFGTIVFLSWALEIARGVSE